jgi:hypothetical protein
MSAPGLVKVAYRRSSRLQLNEWGAGGERNGCEPIAVVRLKAISLPAPSSPLYLLQL